MNGLRYLMWCKAKAQVRNAFSRPLSAILTTLAILFYLGMAGLTLVSRNTLQSAGFSKSFEPIIMIYLAYVLLFFVSMTVQKRTALVYQTDAYYVFTGPFTRKQVLTYILVDTVKGCVLYAFITSFFLTIIIAGQHLTPLFLLVLLLSSLILYFVLFTYVTYFYLLDITMQHSKVIKIGLIVVLLLLIAGLAAQDVIQANYQISTGLQAFLSNRLFYVIPFFGWTKLVLMSAAASNMAGLLIGTLLNLAGCALFIWLVLHVKGDFYERAIEDAEWITKLRADAREGKGENNNLRKRIKNVKSVHFFSGAFAIFSENMLQLRKSGGFLKKQELILLVVYLIMAKVANYNFVAYQYFVMLILFIAVTTESIVNELKMHYIYLIPDSPLNKLLSMIGPILLRTYTIALIAIVPGAILLKGTLLQAVIAFLTMSGFATIFVAGNLWSIRLLKSRNNLAASQFLKMILILLATIPTILVSILVLFLLGFNSPNLFQTLSLISVVCNLIFGAIAIIFSQSIFKGSNIMSD